VSTEQPEQQVLVDQTFAAPGIEVHVRVEAPPPADEEPAADDEQDERPAGDVVGDALAAGAGLAAKAVETVAGAAWDLLKPRESDEL
jgi:hypothetical protein